MTTYTVTPVLKNLGILLEGPQWDSSTSTLLFTDIRGKKIHRFDPETEKLETLASLEDQVSAVVPCASGGLLACVGLKVVRLTGSGQSAVTTTIAEVERDKPGNQFNDAKCDPAGRLWAGTMGPEPKIFEVKPHQGSLYSLDPQDNNVIKNHRESVSCSNGMGWSRDGKTFYFIDSLLYAVEAYDFDVATGTLSNLRTVVEIPQEEGAPDGMCVDGEDMIWVALITGGQVNRYNPQTGEKILSIKFPEAKNVTSCCFGGKELDVLYVTSSIHTGKENSKPLDGSLFKVTNLGVKGLPSISYKI